MKNKIDEILKYNVGYVEEKLYVPHITDGKPKLKLAIVTCMDTRLTVMLSA